MRGRHSASLLLHLSQPFLNHNVLQRAQRFFSLAALSNQAQRIAGLQAERQYAENRFQGYLLAAALREDLGIFKLGCSVNQCCGRTGVDTVLINDFECFCITDSLTFFYWNGVGFRPARCRAAPAPSLWNGLQA